MWSADGRGDDGVWLHWSIPSRRGSSTRFNSLSKVCSCHSSSTTVEQSKMNKTYFPLYNVIQRKQHTGDDMMTYMTVPQHCQSALCWDSHAVHPPQAPLTGRQSWECPAGLWLSEWIWQGWTSERVTQLSTSDPHEAWKAKASIVDSSCWWEL